MKMPGRNARIDSKLCIVHVCVYVCTIHETKSRKSSQSIRLLYMNSPCKSKDAGDTVRIQNRINEPIVLA